jgi:hypothetical protein
MKHWSKLLTLLFAFILIQQTAQAQKGISYWEIRRIVKHLSSDEMRGREAGSENARMAAQYISNYFEELELEPLPGEYSYYQNFDIYELENKDLSLQINELPIPKDEFFMISQQQEVNWKDLSDVQHIHIGKEEDFGQKMRELYNTEKNMLVTVDGKHSDLFNRYSNYFGGAFKTMKLQEGATKVFVLSNEISVNSIDFKAEREVTKIQMANVAGMIPGKSRPEEYVVFSAHYDHIGIMDAQEGDSIANGADDDASGTTAVMALARHFKEIGGAERSLIFVGFTAEEMGGYGSRYFSQQLDSDKIMAMFNIEMIGKESKFGPRTAFITGYERSDFGKLLQEELQGSKFEFHPDPYPEQNLFYRSDNATLARLGVPAHTISTTQIDKDKYYHTVKDEFKTLELRNMRRIIEAIAISSKGIVNGEQTPSRVEGVK